MLLSSARTRIAAKCLEGGTARLGLAHVRNLRTFCADTRPSSEVVFPKQRPARVRQKQRHVGFKGNAKLTPPEDSRPRFQPFGRPGGHGEVVAASILGEGVLGATGDEDSSSSLGRKDAISWLERNVVLARYTAEGMLDRHGKIAEQSVEQLDERLRWFRGRLGLSVEATRKILVKRPSLLCKGVEDKLEPLVRWTQDELGLDDEEVAKTVTLSPQLLQSNTEGMKSKIAWLEKRLGLTHGEAVRVFRACPFILTNSVEDALAPRLTWILDNLVSDEGNLREWILANPRVIGHGVWSTLAPTLNFLEDKIGLDGSRARSFLSRNPLFFKSPHKLERDLVSRQVWLRITLGVADDDTVRGLLQREPRLLTRSVSRLDDTLTFLGDSLGATTEDVRDAVLVDASVLLAGKETLWGPRIAAFKKAGVEPLFRRHWRVLLSRPQDFDKYVKTMRERARSVSGSSHE